MRRLTSRQFVLAVCICLLTALLAACSSKSGTPDPAPGSGSGSQGSGNKAVNRTLNVALFGEPDFIDPHVYTSVGFVPVENAYESLVYTDRDTTQIVGQLAESYEATPDGTSFTFTLRQGVKFHDGTTMDAEAVKFSFERLKKLNKGSAWVLEYLESINIVDPYTVEMKVRPGGPPFLGGVTNVRIVSPKAIQEHEKNGDLAQDFLNNQSAGTGPYKILSWERSQKVVLQKFDEYWGGWENPNHFTAVNMLIIPEASTQRLMLEKGEIDIAMKFPVEALPSLEQNPDLQILRAPGLRVFYLRIQNAAPPTDDVRVRQAINYAFDGDTFRQVMENTYDAPVGPVPALFLDDWKPNYPYKYDVEKAKQLLTQAGYSTTKKAKLIADILTATPDQRKAAEILQAGLAATGMAELDIRENEWAPMLNYNVDWQTSKDPATAHHLFGLFTPPRIPDAYSYLWYLYAEKATGSFARNVMNYGNPKVDDLLIRAAAATDRATQIDLYRQATQQIVDDASDLFIGTQTKVYVYRQDVKGFFAHPTWYPAVQVYYLFRG